MLFQLFGLILFSAHVYGSFAAAGARLVVLEQHLCTPLYYLLSYFRCECPDGRFGVTCDESASACTTGRHKCEEDSKCSVMKDGNYECLCPLGKTGKFCETTVFISDPLFTGGNSFMSLTLDSAIRFNTEINLEIRPDSMDGLIVHFGQSRDARHQDYFTIMLKNSTLVSIFILLN